MKYRLVKNQRLKHLISAPFIYSLIIPFLFLDAFLEVYHHVGFRLYDLDIVNRDKYIKLDRHKLAYLNPIEKLNCAYCGYLNGLINYTSEIGARTESYWCGIKHEMDNDFKEPKHHSSFLNYGDKISFGKLFK
ncbi:hypothetical protein HOD61_01710 [archaeon]|jgi:hypothetical protein|nr:hypothetical protein [archaeon]